MQSDAVHYSSLVHVNHTQKTTTWISLDQTSPTHQQQRATHCRHQAKSITVLQQLSNAVINRQTRQWQQAQRLLKPRSYKPGYLIPVQNRLHFLTSPVATLLMKWPVQAVRDKRALNLTAILHCWLRTDAAGHLQVEATRAAELKLETRDLREGDLSTSSWKWPIPSNNSTREA